MALRLIFNPIAGEFQYINDATSGPGASKYVGVFNATSDWTLNVSQYEITTSAVTHGAGTSPMVEVLELSGSDYLNVMVSIKVNASGDVTIIVNSTPDLRFIGKLIIY